MTHDYSESVMLKRHIEEKNIQVIHLDPIQLEVEIMKRKPNIDKINRMLWGHSE